MSELLGLELGEHGSNVRRFAHLFADGVGDQFAAAAAKAFASAELEMQASQTKEEIRDRVAQAQLAAHCNSDQILVPEAELPLEKGHGGRVVWNYSICVFEGQKGRGWTLPDGLIRYGEDVYAVEFDHGKTIGRWARQLAKAVRLTASSSIAGVIFCYWLDAEGSRAVVRRLNLHIRVQDVS